MTNLTPVDDAIFEAAVHKVAPRPWDRYTKIIEGAQARAILAERERDEMAAELATMKESNAALRKEFIQLFATAIKTLRSMDNFTRGSV
jgi:hypothetical protein